MKLMTFSQDDSIHPGILIEDAIIDILTAWPGPNPPRSVKEILERGPSCFSKLAKIATSAKASIPLSSVRLLAPIQRPGKILALAGNYAKHIIEA
ncbi:MAG: hypothetical protein JXN61_13505, partial [Sedimentisphaerales bacterium]|nr:hypothetical protein [Sedimentisphaerales bacterium]